MRNLAYVETIKNLKPIPNADNIECAEILGWEVVVKRNQFKIGDAVIYCEIDSILPELPPFEFLRPKKFRIKTCKLRGCISQGIAFPLSVLKEVDPSVDLSKFAIGQDVTDLLKIVKYDPEAALDDIEEVSVEKPSWFERKLRYYKWKLFGIKPQKRGTFPDDVPKTDEIRVQKMGKLLSNKAGSLVYITEKCEGTSGTFIYRKTGNWLADLFGMNGIFQVCSRNRIIFNSQKGGKQAHHLCTVAEKYNIHAGMKRLNRNLAIQAECIGPKIQGNIYKLPELELRVFSAYDIDKQRYVDYEELFVIAGMLDIPMVPVLDVDATLQDSISYYVELSKGKSKNNPKVDREGIVIRAMDSSFSFKSINPEYLLKQE